jgi:hypothetical protein
MSDNMTELEIRLANWERESKNYNMQIMLEKTVMLRLSRKEKGQNNKLKQDKQVKRFTFLGSMVEKMVKYRQK